MEIKHKLRKVSFSIVLILLIPVFLNLIWFKEGNILGAGESGLPFYDFNIQQNINKDAWAYYTLGHPINIGAAAAPTYWFLAKLQNLGIPTFVLQATFLWLIFITSGLAVYKLVKMLFPDADWIQALVAVLFYWFNPFSLVNVWNRFLNNFFVFYALLPLVIYLFIKGLKSQNLNFAILIALVSAILSYALTSMVFILLLWGTLFYLGIFQFLSFKKNQLFIIKFFLLVIIFWSLTNLWWISQVFSYLGLGSFDAVTNTSFTKDTNYNTFFLISERLGNLIDIFRLRHASFFNNNQLEWIKLYTFPVIIFLDFLVASIFLLPLLIRKKDLYVLMFGGLLLISIFFAKGNSPPLGELFDRVFLHFSFMQLFRNPFEKIGFILSFSATILFAYGFLKVESFLKYRWKTIFRAIIIFWLVIIWGFPFWTGYVFTADETPINNVSIGYQVKVPTVYKDISNLISSKTGNFRLVVLPIGGEGITYTWEKGYSGVELSNQILPKAATSFNTNIPFYDDISNALGRLISTREGLAKIMDILNSKYVLVRKDIDWKTRRMRDPDNISQRIEKIASASSLEKIKEAGNLTFWEDLSWEDRSIYLTTNLVESKPISPMEDILNVETDNWAALYNSKIPSDDGLTKYEIIHPGFKFSIGEKNIESSIILRDDIVFPAVNILPSSPLYFLIQQKEKFETARISDQNYKIIKRISLLGKRLVEADKEAVSGNFDAAIKALDQYNLQLQELSRYPLGDNPNARDRVAFIQEELYKVFLRHYKSIDQLMSIFPNNKKNRLTHTRKLLRNFLLNLGIEPIFGYMEREDYPLINRAIYQFTVDKEGSYELLFNIPNWNNHFKKSFNEPVLFQVDENLIARKGEMKTDGLLSFGFLSLFAGNHEIGWNGVEPINLIDAPAEFSMEIDHGILEKSFPIKNLDPFSTYVLNVDYLIKKGSGVLVSIEGNNDSIKKGIVQRQFRKNLGQDVYDYAQKRYTAYYTPARTSDTANLIFSVFPWNNCNDIYRTNRMERCEDEEFKKPYDRNTEVVISDVSLVKIMTETPFLKLKRSGFEDSQLPELSFQKLNNSSYEVYIKNAKEKYALILSELYDPAWVITDKDGIVIAKNHFLANSYANGWILDQKGDYQIKVKFIPQDLLEKSRLVSIIAFVSGLILVSFAFFRKAKK